MLKKVTPLVVDDWPVSNAARAGVQIGFGLNARVNRTPAFARRSIFGVFTVGSPAHPSAEALWSSESSTTTFGFDPARAGKLFSPFHRLHREDEFEGHGLGLANVRRILHRIGGDVTADSEPDAGATFYFRIADAAHAADAIGGRG